MRERELLGKFIFITLKNAIRLPKYVLDSASRSLPLAFLLLFIYYSQFFSIHLPFDSTQSNTLSPFFNVSWARHSRRALLRMLQKNFFIGMERSKQNSQWWYENESSADFCCSFVLLTSISVSRVWGSALKSRGFFFLFIFYFCGESSAPLGQLSTTRLGTLRPK